MGKSKKPVVIGICVVLLLAMFACSGGGNSSKSSSSASASTSASVSASSATSGTKAEVTVPDVVGKAGNEALSDLEFVGLEADFVSDSGKKVVKKSNWTVAEQNPAAGATAHEGDTVKLKVTKGGATAEESDGEEAASAKASDNGQITAEKFNAIQQGMTYQQVVDIIGSEGVVVSSSSVSGIEMVDYQWESGSWGIATVMFENDAVVNKTQLGVGGSSGAKVSLETFNKIENGMTYQQVVELVGGEGQLISETEILGSNMSIYSWDGNTLLSTCEVTLEDGVVTSKSQYGLK